MPTVHTGNSTRRDRWLSIAALLFSLAGWSSVPLFLKYFVPHMDAWTSNGWRYATAALFWLPMLLFQSQGSLARNAGIWRDALWPAVFNTLGQIAFAWVLYLQVGPGMMTFLLRSQIVFVAVGAFLLFPDERALLFRLSFWFGLAFVALGTVGTIFLGEDRPRGATSLGVVAGILSGALFGAYGLSIRAKMKRYSAMHAFAVISLYSAAAMVALMCIWGSQPIQSVARLSAFQIAMLVLSAMIGIAFGHVFYYMAIARLGVAATSSVLLMQPFLTGAFSWWRFGEKLTAAQWVSGSLSVVGAVIIIRAQSRLLPADPPPSEVRPPPPQVSTDASFETAAAGR